MLDLDPSSFTRRMNGRRNNEDSSTLTATLFWTIIILVAVLPTHYSYLTSPIKRVLLKIFRLLTIPLMQPQVCMTLILCFINLRRESKKETEAEMHRAGLVEPCLTRLDLNEYLAIKDSSLEFMLRTSMGRLLQKSPQQPSRKKYLWVRTLLPNIFPMRECRVFPQMPQTKLDAQRKSDTTARSAKLEFI